MSSHVTDSCNGPNRIASKWVDHMCLKILSKLSRYPQFCNIFIWTCSVGLLFWGKYYSLSSYLKFLYQCDRNIQRKTYPQSGMRCIDRTMRLFALAKYNYCSRKCFGQTYWPQGSRQCFCCCLRWLILHRT